MKSILRIISFGLCLQVALVAKSQTYCSPSPSAGLFLNTVDFNSGFTGGKTYSNTYGGYTQTIAVTSGSIQRQESAIIYATLSNTSTTTSFPVNTVNFRVYADWNKDGDFNDVDEQLCDLSNTAIIMPKVGSSNGYASFAIYPTISTLIPSGNIRMRFALRQSGGAALACGSYTGEVEDYIITIVGNTAPVLDISTLPKVNPLRENQVDSKGFTVTQLVNSTLPAVSQIVEADYTGGPEPYGIAITGTSGAGTWQYKLLSGAWTAFGAVSISNSLLLLSDMTTSIRFVPTSSGNATLSYKAWDRTAGGNGLYGNASTVGGASAYSVNTQTLTLPVTALASVPSTKLFIVSSVTDQVMSTNMNPATSVMYEADEVVTSNANLTNATDIAYDYINDKIVWTESATTGKIVRMSQAGSNVEAIVSAGLTAPIGIAISGSKLFIADNGGTKGIFSANLDGTGMVTITGGSGQMAIPNTIRDVEYYGNQLYVITRPLSTGDYKITKLNVDGSSPVELFSTPNIPRGLAVDNNTVYWTEVASSVSYLKSGPTTGGGGAGTSILTAPGRAYRDVLVDLENSKVYIMDISGSGATTLDRCIQVTSLSGGTVSKALLLNDSYSNFVLPMGAVSLPVDLVSFEAKLLAPGEVLLKWTTATEKVNDYFTIERSGNGRDFTEIARVKGKGGVKQRYSVTDYAPLPGTNYYRLKQTDIDGSTTDLRTQMLRNDVPVQLVQVYPNPVVGNSVTLRSVNPSLLNRSYNLVDYAGRVVLSGNIIGENQIINVSSLLRGYYILRISSGEQFKIERR